MPQQEVSEVYADMLEYRQQMYEDIPYAHCFYRVKFEALWALPLTWRRYAIGTIGFDEVFEDWKL